MKKLIIFLAVCLIFLPSMYAEETHHEPEFSDIDDAPHTPRSVSMKRGFEFGIDINALFSNNLLTVGEVFSDTIIIDVDRISQGLMASFGVGAGFSINIDSKKGWGFGFSFGLEGTGIFNTGSILSFNDVKDEPMDLGGALYAVADINTFFHVQKFKIIFNPSMFWAAAYFNPNITYTLNTNDGIKFGINAREVRVYTAMPYELLMDEGIFELTGSPGFDLTLGVEYPLAKEMGITSKIPFLDFDVGIGFQNIPIVPSILRDYYGMPDINNHEIDLMDMITGSSESEENKLDTDFTSGKAEASFDRAFKLLLYANWRPLFGSKLLTVTPVLGLSHDFLYAQKVSFEGGVTGTLNLADMFYASFGINYFDRVWINSLDLAVNLRAFQLDLGIDMRSQDFIRSWSAGGLGIKVGLKFGW